MHIQITKFLSAAIACAILLAVCAVGSAEPETPQEPCIAIQCDALMQEGWCADRPELKAVDHLLPYLAVNELLTAAVETSRTLVLERGEMGEECPPDFYTGSDILTFTKLIVVTDPHLVTPELRKEIYPEMKKIWVGNFFGPYRSVSIFSGTYAGNCYLWHRVETPSRWFFQDFDFNAKMSARLKELLSLEEAPVVYVQYLCAPPGVCILTY